jgi:hypothetical protein
MLGVPAPSLRARMGQIERWLGIRALFWPDAMAPVNFFNGSLISDTISESQHGALLHGLRGRAEKSQLRRQRQRFVRQIKSRRKSDNADEKKERGCRASNSVPHKARSLPETRFTCRAQKPLPVLAGGGSTPNAFGGDVRQVRLSRLQHVRAAVPCQPWL